jgi:hypothetical protein
MLKSRRPCRDWIHGNTESWGRNPELNRRSPRARRGSAAIRRVRLPPVAIGSPKLRRIRPKAGAPGRTRTIDPLSGRSLGDPEKTETLAVGPPERVRRPDRFPVSVPCFPSRPQRHSEKHSTPIRVTRKGPTTLPSHFMTAAVKYFTAASEHSADPRPIAREANEEKRRWRIRSFCSPYPNPKRRTSPGGTA